MAGPFDFTGQNIENTYQRVLQTDGNNIYDGTGSLFTLPSVDTSSLVTTSSFNNFTSSYNTGSFTGSFIGSLLGTASWAYSASNAISASYIKQAESASYVQLQGSPNSGIIVNGLEITASLRTVNGISPINGNVAISLGAVITGLSSSLSSSFPFISPDYPPLPPVSGTLFIVSGETGGNVDLNGDAYVFVTSSTQTGQWQRIYGFDSAAGDARYARIDIANIQNLTASFSSTASYVTGSVFTSANPVLSSSYALTASFVSTASYVIGSIFTSTNPALSSSYALTASFALNSISSAFPYNGTVTPAVISGSLIVSGSGITVTGSLVITGSDALVNGVRVGLGPNSSSTNLVVGSGSLLTLIPPQGGAFSGVPRWGSANVILGNQAQNNNSSGSGNTAIGFQAMTGGYNLAQRNSHSGSYNTAIGFQALQKTSNGNSNVAIGYQALQDNTTGTYNIGLGDLAGGYNAISTRNISIGYQAGKNIYANARINKAFNFYTSNNTAVLSGVTAIGADALEAALSPFLSTAIGNNAMRYVNVSYANTAIGPDAIGDIRQYFSFTGSTSIFGGNPPSCSILFTGSLSDMGQYAMQGTDSPFYKISASFSGFTPASTTITSSISGSTLRFPADTPIPGGSSVHITVTPSSKTLTNYALSNYNTAIGPNSM